MRELGRPVRDWKVSFPRYGVTSPKVDLDEALLRVVAWAIRSRIADVLPLQGLYGDLLAEALHETLEGSQP